MQKKLRKLLNLIHAYLDMLLARENPRAYPLDLSVGTTSFCNLHCIQCPREGHDGNRIPFDEHLDLPYYEGLQPLLERAKDVSLYGLGEPLIDRRYFEKVRYVVSYGADVSLSTNGTLMDEARCRELIESGVKSVGISLDASCEATFARVRPPGGLTKIVENIQCLTRLKNEMGSTLPMLRLSFGIMAQNLADLPDFPQLAANVGCQEIIVHPVIYMSYDKMQELYVDPSMLREPVERARERARELGIPFYFWDLDPLSFLKSLNYAREWREGHIDKDTCACVHNAGPHFCFFLWRNAMIQGRGEMFPCCYITNVHLGRLDSAEPLAWRSHPFLTDMRRRLFEGDIPDPCARCPQLQPFDRSVILKSGLQEILNFIRHP